MFIHIAKTGEISLLNAGKNAIEVWEEIVRRNCEVNGVHEYGIYINTMRSYALLINDYIVIKAHLIKLCSQFDKGSVDFLTRKGYIVDTSSNEKYIESLTACMRKRENLMTRINMKKKELENLALQNKNIDGKGEKSLEELLAIISFQIGFSVNDNITLARFNEYNKILKMQNSEAKKYARA